jgi:hypothetical protein
MATLQPPLTPEETQADFTAYFDEERQGTVESLHRLAYIPDHKLERLAAAVLEENWGNNHWVLERYLAIHVGLAVKQKRIVLHDGRLVMCAGHLQTRYGTPVYLSFDKNRQEYRQPLYLQYVGDKPNVPQLPQPADMPAWPPIRGGAEIIIAHEHILEQHQERVAFLAETPRVAQMCALAGAIQWSLFRDLAIRQLYLGIPSYFVPVYLQSREDITKAPDLIAPVQVQGDRLYVRTALEPYMGYAWARVVATRHDQLPHWLVTAWHDRADLEDAAAVEGVEREELLSPSSDSRTNSEIERTP